MWYTILIIVHVLACVFLTVVVLLQAGKGSDISAVFGGSSQTLFGSSGASTFLSKLTTWTAVVFMTTSLTLTYGAAKRSSRSIFDTVPPVSAPAPAPTGSIPPAPVGASTEGQGTATPSTGESAQVKPATPESAPATPTAPAAPAVSAPAPTPPQQQSSPSKAPVPAPK